MIPIIKVQLGAYVPEHLSTKPGRMESYSLPKHLRPDTATVVPNRAARRARRR